VSKLRGKAAIWKQQKLNSNSKAKYIITMDIKHINTIGELKEAGYQPKSIKEEIRQNLVKKLQNKEETFSGIIGYEDTVIPDVERA
jgi:magnesium chelatase subunit I